MPAPANPPFEAGALTQPRQLQRWLDCNKVNKLNRAETYITIPAFSLDVPYRGYSEIVGVFNFTAQSNFSLKSFTAPENPNYVACVAWLDEDENIQRYKLWSNPVERFYVPVEIYNHQKILGNFRVEIWNVSPGVLSTFTVQGAGDVIVNGLYISNGINSYVKGSVDLTLDNTFWYMSIVASGGGLWYTTEYNFPYGVWLNTEGQVPGALDPENTPSNIGNPPAPSITLVNYEVSQASAITIYTSKKQSYDYRFATDTTLATPSAVVTDFDSTLDLPFTFPTNSVPAEN